MAKDPEKIKAEIEKKKAELKEAERKKREQENKKIAKTAARTGLDNLGLTTQQIEAEFKSIVQKHSKSGGGENAHS